MNNYFTIDDAKEIGNQLQIDWSLINLEQFHKGLNVELEHGTNNPDTNVTNNDPVQTGKIALAHLHELPNYYDRLEAIEEEEEK
jgi:hypothetical protein